MIGTLDAAILEAVLETIPIEFSIIDKDDKVLAWNKHETRIFKRSKGALGRDVRDCHPRKSLAVVEQLIAEMKAGTRDMARFWIDLPIGPEKASRKVLIEYHAVRDSEGTYLGCLEASRDIADIQTLSGERRLLA